MQITERNPLGPHFDRRLRAALDRVAPPTPAVSRARYRSEGLSSHRPWRFAAAVVVAGACSIAAVSAFAATGSPNPAIWTQRAASTIRAAGHIAAPKPALTIPHRAVTHPGLTPPNSSGGHSSRTDQAERFDAGTTPHGPGWPRSNSDHGRADDSQDSWPSSEGNS